MERIFLLVIVIVISVLKCLAMSIDEIEDFKNYVTTTSQLDQHLKKGVDPDDQEDESVSDHAWEESGKFEGDLILNDRQRRFIIENVAEGLSRNGLNDGTKRWPNNEVIYFIQREHFTKDQAQAIEDGIDDLERASCVKFRPYIKGDRNAVVIQGSRRGCFSQVGYQGGYQVVNLSGRHPVGRGCFRHGTIIHELLHTLGFFHMQSSPDRDDYIDVIWDNIIKKAKHNFRKYNSFAVTDFGVGYDYDSVLHYSRRAFTVNGRDTLVPKQNGVTIGQRIGLSDKDTQKLNKMYCDANFDTQTTDDVPSKKPGKNKSLKNKPFDGHGLGYHQGKTVVIKLLPAPETYKLPDMPSSHVFDYFSKAPQILPSPQIEGHRIGKGIADVDPPYEFKNYSPSTSSILQDYNKYINPEIQQSTQDNRQDNNESEYISKYNNDDRTRQSLSYESLVDAELSRHPIYDLNEAYDKLANVVKHNVYPSQSSNTKLIGLNKDYSEFYIPSKLREKEIDVHTPTVYTSKETNNSNFKHGKYLIENPYETREASGRARGTNSQHRIKNNIDDYYYY